MECGRSEASEKTAESLITSLTPPLRRARQVGERAVALFVDRSIPIPIRRLANETIRRGQELVGVFVRPDELATRLTEDVRDDNDQLEETVKVLEVDVADKETRQVGLQLACQMALDILHTTPSPDDSARARLDLIGETLTEVPGYPFAGLDLPRESIGMLSKHYAIPPLEEFRRQLPPPTAPSAYGDF